MIEAKQIHCGQYNRYGDFFRVWEITTDLPRENVVEWCFENLYKRRVPFVTEWRQNIRFGAPRFSDAGYYFAGYYDLTLVNGGYEFKICEPFAD